MVYRLYTIVLLLLVSTVSFSQFGNSFFEERLIQGPNDEASIVISLPSISTSLYSGGFTYGDIYESDSKILNIVTAADFDSDFNLIANARASYGGVSFKKNNLTYSIHHEWTADANINIPETMFDVIVNGNAQFENSNFQINPSFQYLSIHRWSLGATYANDRLHLGGQLHIYQGDEAIYGNQFEINVNAEEDFFALTFEKNIEVKSSGILNYKSLEDVQFIGNNSVFSAKPFSKNFGIGASIEAAYNVSDALRLFGRIDDIGTINWKQQSVSYTDTSVSAFNGIDIRDSYVNDEPYSIKDTLYDLLTIEENLGSFKGAIPISFLAGCNYDMTDKLDIGILIRGKQTANAVQAIVQVKAGYQLSENILISGSNTLVSGSAINLGLGFRWRLANTFNLYLDTINPWKFSKYYDSNLLHLNFGTYITL